MRVISSSPHDDYWFEDVEAFSRIKYGIDRIELYISTNVTVVSGSVYESNGIVYSIISDVDLGTAPTYQDGHYYFVRTDGEDLILEDLTSLPTVSYDPLRKGVYSSTNEKYLAQLYPDGVSYMIEGQINDLQDYKINGTSIMEQMKETIKEKSILNLKPISIAQLQYNGITEFAIGNGVIIGVNTKQRVSDNLIKGTVYKSDDGGFTWSDVTPAAGSGLSGNEQWKHAMYKEINGVKAFYIVTSNLNSVVSTVGIMRSIDNGSTWTLVGSSATTAPRLFEWMNDRLVLYGDNDNKIIHSTNGTSWTTTTTGIAFSGFQGIAYGNGKYVMIRRNTSSPFQNYSYTSTNLSSWTGPHTIGNGKDGVQGYFHQIAFNNGKFVAILQGDSTTTQGNSVIATSTDGSTWTVNEVPWVYSISTGTITAVEDYFVVESQMGLFTINSDDILNPIPSPPWFPTFNYVSTTNHTIVRYYNKYFPDDKVFIIQPTQNDPRETAGLGTCTAYISSSFSTNKYIEAL